MKKFGKPLALLLALLLLSCSLASCAKKNEKAVGVCGEYEILYEELRYETLTYLAKHPECTEEELRQAVEQAIKERYAVLVLCKEYTPSASADSPEMEERVNADIDSLISSLDGKSEYKSYLKELYATENFFKKFLAITLMQQDLENAVFQGTELESSEALLNWWKDGNCVNATKLSFSDQATAEAAREKLEKRISLQDLLKDEAFSSVTVADPMYYFRSMRNTAEEALAMELDQIGDVSSVSASEDGFYFFLWEKENDYENLATYQAPSALSIYRENRISEMILTTAEPLTVEWNEYGAELILREIK